jgi:hypothetical protein
MKNRIFLAATATIGFACLASTTLWAQSSAQSFDLKLPADNAAVDAADSAATRDGGPASNAPAPTVAESSARADASNKYPMPSAFHYDDPNPRNHAAAAPACDDATYNQPQVHGSLGAGIVGGKHVSGNYQTGTVNVTKALGTCENPAGVVSVSVSVSKEKLDRSRRWQH